jgi:hypothetical protein
MAARNHTRGLGGASAEVVRVLYFALTSALEAALTRALEDVLTILRHASQPLGPMGAEWLERLVESDFED